MDFDAALRMSVYRHLVETGGAPALPAMAEAMGATTDAVRAAYARLRARRLLVLEPDGESIRMAPPFSGVATQHRVRVGAREYFAPCAWDALGVAAALGAEALVHSRCEQSLEPLELRVGRAGPDPLPWIAHFAVPAARWWDDIVFT